MVRQVNGTSLIPLPCFEDPHYQQFGLRWLQRAQELGDQVIVRLSGGSTLAAWLALERPEQIDRTLAFAQTWYHCFANDLNIPHNTMM